MDDIGTIEENNAFILGFASKGVLVIDNNSSKNGKYGLSGYKEIKKQESNEYSNLSKIVNYKNINKQENIEYGNLSKISDYTIME